MADLVADAWRFNGLLVVFEATVGVLSVSGGHRTQLGYAGVMARAG
jgi:hypothetical protein